MVVTILGLVLGSTLAAAFRTDVFSGDFTRQTVIDQTGWRVMDRLGFEIQAAYPPSVLPVLMEDSHFITFQAVEGMTNSGTGTNNLVLSDAITIAYEPGEGELDNGVDDNGDGRIDEGYLTYTKLNQTPVRVAGNVLAVRFNPVVNGISFSVDIGLVSRDGQVSRKTFTEQVTFRN